MRLRQTRRDALSLLEVIIALATFLLALVGLGYLLTVAGNLALDTQFRSQAALLCQSKLAEVSAGAVALESRVEVPFDEDDAYKWSLDAQQATAGLYNVTIIVSRKRPDGTTLETSLSQMVLDPKMVGSVHDEPPTIGSTTTDAESVGGAASSSSSSSSGGSGASSGGSGASSGGSGSSGGGASSGGGGRGGSTGGGSGGGRGGSSGGGGGMSGGGGSGGGSRGGR